MAGKKRGFTLIELLVVVAIIALLIAILLPSLGRARKQANTTKCLANVRGMGMAAQIFITDRSGMLPYDGSGDATNFWVNVLRPYGQLNKLRTCPEATQLWPGVPSSSATSWQGGSAGTDPTTNKPYYGSYGMNGFILSTKGASADLYQWANQGWSAGTADASYFWNFPFTQASDTIPAFSDANWYDGWPHASDTAPTTTINTNLLADADPHMRRFLVNRHNMVTPVAFLDGHGEAVPMKNMWLLKWNTHWGMASSEPIPRTLPKVPSN